MRTGPTCYLCGQPGADSSEHSIPRSFYFRKAVPDEARDLTHPAHARCNKSTASDEEWVAHNLALSRPLGGAATSERWDRAIRAMTRPQAQGMKAKLLDGMQDLPDGGALLRMGEDRVDRVLVKIAKGLCFRDHAHVIPSDAGWLVRVTDYSEIVAIDYHNTLDEVSDVLFAKGVAVPAKGLFAWWMVLFGQHPYAVISVPRGVMAQRGNPDVEAMLKSYAWPAGEP